MPKASMMSSKAIGSGSYGIQSGKVKVIGARYKIVQHRKNDGTPITPMCVLQLDVTKCNADGQVIDDTDTSQKDLILSWQNKESGTFAFHPADGKSSTDTDPKDLGNEIETEGNTLVSTGERTSLFANDEALLFAKSIELAGWNPQINDQCWAPNYVGMVFDVETVTKAALCKEFGIRYNAQEGRAESSDTVWKVLKIDVQPYEQKGSGITSKKASTSSASSESTAAKPNGEASTELQASMEALATSTVKKVAGDFKGKDGIPRAKFQAAVMTQLHRDKQAKNQTAVMKLVKDDEWIINTGGELGFMIDTEQGVLSFVE